ncbi:MAG: PQQ-binding-like beta-propeller repeat protein [Candidatus Hydrogenedentes bacterium]|nr:PQQ-binding-like beta-propeller repeat protein [Candidatus Hydrogenedentota bacterium]
MRSTLRNVAIVTLAMALLVTPAVASDWPQFQGPNRDGASPETGLIRSWPEGPAEVAWTFPLGPGYGGPAVRDGEVYILDRVDEQQDVLRCIGLESGKERWHFAYDAPGSVGHSGSRTTPTVDEKCVYSVGMMGDFVCVDRTTHQPAWKHNILTDFGNKPPNWGVSQSPSLWRNLAIIAPQAKEAYVAAYERTTGEIVWKAAADAGVGYSTPVIATLGGVEQVVMLAPGGAAGYALDDGKKLWAYDGWQCRIPIPYPTALPGDRLFITGGYGAGSAMIRIRRDGDGFGVEELFRTEECGSQIHQPLFIDGYLYANSNSNDRQDGMVCMSLDGKVQWRTKDVPGLPLFERGNLLFADGMIVSLDGKTGVLHLIEPSPQDYKQLAQVKVLDGRKMWSPMALSQGRLLVRDQEQMKCLDLRSR